MQITRIDIEGRQGHYATVQVKKPDGILVEILTPDNPDGKTRWLATPCKNGMVITMSMMMAEELDGDQAKSDDYLAFLKQMVK